MDQENHESENSKKCIICESYYPTDVEKCTKCDLPLTPISNDLSNGEVIGDKYEIDALIGDGGMGKVYRATHKLMKKKVAIKMLHSGLVGQSSTLRRFKKEAEASSSLDHTNIVKTLDFGLTPDGRPYLVMDYLEGLSFAELLAAEKLIETERCLRLFIQLCSGLEHAHTKGIVHRDIKPSNIIIVKDEKQNEIVKILDFGIAKKVTSSKEGQGGEPEKLASSVTEAGTVFGSPLYMSPEQVRGESVDMRSDIYSLSCLLYQCLTGTPLYQADEAMDCMYLHVNQEPEPFNHRCPTANIPDSLQAIVFKGLRKNPDERIQTMEEFESTLQAELAVIESDNSTSDQVNCLDSDSTNLNQKTDEADTEKIVADSVDATTEVKATEKEKAFDYVNVLVPVSVVIVLLVLSSVSDIKLFDSEEAQSPKSPERRASSNNTEEASANRTRKSGDNSDKKKKSNDSDTTRIEEKERKPLQLPAGTKNGDTSKESATSVLKVSELLKEGKDLYYSKQFTEAQKKFVLANDLARSLGTNSLEYLDSVTWLGKTLLARKQYQSAAIYLKWSARMFEKKYGSGSRFTREAKDELANVNAKLSSVSTFDQTEASQVSK